MIKGFFFDMDGTLVDTHEANYVAYKKALADFNIAIGQQANDFLPQLAPTLNRDDYDSLAAKKAEYYKESLELSKANAELVRFLHMISQDHVTVLVTTARPANAQAVLDRHNLKDYFDHVITNDDVRNSKPAPDCYEVALKKSGLSPNEVIVFEDSATGVSSAQSAGINSIVLVKSFNS
jgi:beta-phosphoglucomutase